MGQILGAALGGLGGLLGGRSQTTTSNSTFNRTGSTSGARTRILTGEQQNQLPRIDNAIGSMLDNPGAGLDPLRDQARNNVNATFSNLPALLRKKYGRTGASGKMGMAARGAETARLGALVNTDADFAGKALDRQQQALSLALQLLGLNMGDSSFQNSSESGSQSGTSTGPSNMASGALSGGLGGAYYGNQAFGKPSGNHDYGF